MAIPTSRLSVHRALLAITTVTVLIAPAPQMIAAGGEKQAAPSAVPGKPCRNGPLVKNLMSLNTRLCNQEQVTNREPSAAHINRMSASVKSSDIYRQLSNYHRMQADKLMASAVAYHQATAQLEQSPQVKNLTAPGTAARYARIEKQLRKEAALQRMEADSQAQLGHAADSFGGNTGSF